MSIILGVATDEQIEALREQGFSIDTENVFGVNKMFGEKATLRPGEKLCLVYLPKASVWDILHSKEIKLDNETVRNRKPERGNESDVNKLRSGSKTDQQKDQTIRLRLTE